MGRKSGKIIKRLEKKVIKNLGQDITWRRMLSSGDTSELDRYGEPLDYDVTVPDEETIRIVVRSIKLEENLTSIGGISNKKKEKLCFYVSQSFAIQIGDQVYFPVNTEKVYEVSSIKPNFLQDENLIYEVEASRDATT